MCSCAGISDEAAATHTLLTHTHTHTYTLLSLRPLLSKGRQCEHTACRGDRATECPAACQLCPRAALTHAPMGANCLYCSLYHHLSFSFACPPSELLAVLLFLPVVNFPFLSIAAWFLSFFLSPPYHSFPLMLTSSPGD